MKRVETILASGLSGMGIGLTWYSIEILLQTRANWKNIQIPFTSLVFWLSASFVIGIFFNLAGLIFEQTQWSLRKQIIVNFFVSYVAFFAFELLINDFNLFNNFDLSVHFFFVVTGAFIVMYLIAYGLYFWQLYQDVKKINQKLKAK